MEPVLRTPGIDELAATLWPVDEDTVGLVATKQIFLGFDKQAIPFERGYTADRDEKDAFRQQHYARIGDYFFLDHNLQDEVEAELPDALKGVAQDRVIYLHDFVSVLALKIHNFYSALTAYAMTQVDVKDKHVLDLGCGDGVQSLIALKRGAAHVTAVDTDEELLELFGYHLKANNIDPGKVTLRQADLSDVEFQKQFATDIEVVVANIGPHDTYGELLDLTAIQALQYLRRVHTYVAGGYQEGIDVLAPNFAVQALEIFGFSNPRHVYANEDEPRTAFIMER